MCVCAEVLDGAERLKELDACSLLPALLRLRELVYTVHTSAVHPHLGTLRVV